MSEPDKGRDGQGGIVAPHCGNSGVGGRAPGLGSVHRALKPRRVPAGGLRLGAQCPIIVCALPAQAQEPLAASSQWFMWTDGRPPPPPGTGTWDSGSDSRDWTGGRHVEERWLGSTCIRATAAETRGPLKPSPSFVSSFVLYACDLCALVSPLFHHPFVEMLSLSLLQTVTAAGPGSSRRRQRGRGAVTAPQHGMGLAQLGPGLAWARVVVGILSSCFFFLFFFR